MLQTSQNRKTIATRCINNYCNLIYIMFVMELFIASMSFNLSDYEHRSNSALNTFHIPSGVLIVNNYDMFLADFKEYDSPVIIIYIYCFCQNIHPIYHTLELQILFEQHILSIVLCITYRIISRPLMLKCHFTYLFHLLQHYIAEPPE